MELRKLATESNLHPVFIMSKFGRVVYANIPGMDIMDHLQLDIGDKVCEQIWRDAKSSFSSSVFMLSVQKLNYKWKLKVLHSGLVYIQAKQAAETNLLFTRE